MAIEVFSLNLKITFLLPFQLSECKSKDKNVTLLKFLVQQIHKSEPALMDFVDDLLPLTLVPEGENWKKKNWFIFRCDVIDHLIFLYSFLVLFAQYRTELHHKKFCSVCF